MLGAGTYVDEPEHARRRIVEASNDAVVDTLGRIGAITMLSTVAVGALALGVNLSEQRKADAKLRAMALRARARTRATPCPRRDDSSESPDGWSAQTLPK